MAKLSVTLKELRAFALTLPETNEEFPWGDPVVKVRKKIFIFLGQGTAPDLKIGLKLYESNHAALGVPGAVPTGYGLGKTGWVTIPIGGGVPPKDILIEWVAESYRLIAPKKLVARLNVVAQ